MRAEGSPRPGTGRAEMSRRPETGRAFLSVEGGNVAGG